MVHYLMLADLPRYDDVYVSKGLKSVVTEQGLIEPIVIMPDGEVFEHHRKIYMAFRQLVDEAAARMQSGDKSPTDTIICAYWAELSKDEQRGL